LRTMGVADHWPTTVNDAAVRYYARRCAHRAPSASKRITSTRRSLEVACFLRYALCTSSDQLLLMLRRWIRKMANDAARETTPTYADAHAKLREFALSVGKLAKDEDLSHADLKSKLVEVTTAVLADPKISRSALARTYLVDHPNQSRALLGRLLTLPLAAQADHPVIQALEVLRKTYAARATSLATTPTIKLGNRWQKIIAGADRQKALAAFEWATLFALRMALRNGCVYLDHSFVFRSQATLFIVKEDWQKSRDMHYAQLGLSKDPKETLEPLAEHLEKRLQDFAAAASVGQIQIDADGIHQERKAAIPEDVRVSALRRALMDGRPLGQLPEIVLEIDSAVRFSWMLLGREPNSRRELLMVYAAVFAHGTLMSASDVSRRIQRQPGRRRAGLQAVLPHRLCGRYAQWPGGARAQGCRQERHSQISQEMGELAKKARDGKLGVADMQGACISISVAGRHWRHALHAHHQRARGGHPGPVQERR
jgi:hypothetical protein